MVAQRPKLIITYHSPVSPMALAAHISAPAKQTPQVTAGAIQTVRLRTITTLQPSVNVAGLPSPAALTIASSKVSGPGPVTLADAAAANRHGLLQSSSDLTITVRPPLVPIV